MSRCHQLIAILILWLTVGSGVEGADSLLILPQAIKLSSPEARQTLLVEVTNGTLITDTVKDGHVWTSRNENVAKVSNGQLIPAGNGSTTILVSARGMSAEVQVVVENFVQTHQWSFRNHVQSVLSKTGCNGGACHGAAAGKNGFRLSLRGYDPEGDFFSITHQSRGRRVVPDDPGRSLLLTKPTGAIPHKGGFRFAEDSYEYRVIAEWIAQGLQPPKANDPRIKRIEILPSAAQLKTGVEQQMIVQAHFSDGHMEDVTRWARYTSTNHSVCSVDEAGLVKVTGSGEGAVVAWYLAQNTTSTVTVPYPQPVSADLFANADRANFIDELVLEKLSALNIPPSPRSPDNEFLRRVFLDTIGSLPTADEAKAFLTDTDPARREKLIESLLARPEFIDYWAYQWSDVLLLSGSRLRPEAIKSYYKWIRDRVSENVSWDEFARGVILSKGSTLENGAANFYALHQDPQDMVETVSMAFLGMSIQCAHCHDHPNEKWTNDDYYGMVSLFSRVRGKGWGGDFRSGDGNRTIFLADRGEVLQPRTARPQPPKPLDAEPASFDEAGDRRELFVNWLTSPGNPYFAKSIANRIWANYMGRGLVEAVDDLRLTNPASNEKLLSRLAEDLVHNKYDLKSLMRTILRSEAYQRTHQVTKQNEFDQRFYSHSQPRRLKAEVLLDAISQVTGVPTAFKDQPANTRALQLPDASIASYFLDTFGRPERILTCTCERSDEPSMTQVLHLTNGKTIQEKLESPQCIITKFIEAKTPDAEIIDTLYVSALTRFPTDDERQHLVTVMGDSANSDRRSVIEDLYWSVLTSREFLFQH